MIFDIIKAIIIAGLPIALFSYYLIILTRTKTQLKSTNATQLKKELKTLELKKNPDENFMHSLLQKKFLKFGGGFYGILTLITYIHIEIYQLIQFVNNFSGFNALFEAGILRLVIAFIIDAVMNLMSAFMWPFYWSDYLPIDSGLTWLVIAILAHTIATRYALSKDVNNPG